MVRPTLPYRIRGNMPRGRGRGGISKYPPRDMIPPPIRNFLHPLRLRRPLGPPNRIPGLPHAHHRGCFPLRRALPFMPGRGGPRGLGLRPPPPHPFRHRYPSPFSEPPRMAMIPHCHEIRGLPPFRGRGPLRLPSRGRIPMRGMPSHLGVFMPGNRDPGIRDPVIRNPVNRGRGGKLRPAGQEDKDGKILSDFERAKIKKLTHPWVTPEIRIEIRLKHGLYQKYRRSATLADHNIFKEQRNKVTSLIRDAKLKYIEAHPDEDFVKELTEASLLRDADKAQKKRKTVAAGETEESSTDEGGREEEGEAGNLEVSKEACIDTSLHETCENTSIEEPCTDTSTEEPCTDTSLHEPCTDTSLHEPCTDTSLHEPCENTSAEEPCTDTSLNEPCENTSTEEPCTDTSLHEPCTSLHEGVK